MQPYCLDQGVGVIPWSPLARGRLTRPWGDGTARTRDRRLRQDPLRRTVEPQGRSSTRSRAVAAERGVPAAQVALAWMMGKPAVTAPIVGATKPQHLADAVAAVDLELSADEVRGWRSTTPPAPLRVSDPPLPDCVCPDGQVPAPAFRAPIMDPWPSSAATRTTSPPGSPPTAATATRSSRAATGSSSPGPARGPTARSSCAGCSVWRTCCRWASAGPTHDERSWTFDLDPGGVDPVLGIERLQDAYFKRFPGYERGITVPAIVDVPTGEVVTNDFAQMTLDLSTEWTRVPPRRRARPVSRRACGTRSTRSTNVVYRDVNNGVYRCRLRRRPGGVRARPTDRLFDRLDWLTDRLAEAALPRRRHHHRGRRPAVHDAGPLRRRLPRPLQVQPQQARRDARAVGLRPRPVPDARLRRHHRLRADQAALLRRAPRHQPHRHRPRRPRPVATGCTPHGREELGGRPFGDGTPPGPPLPAEAVPAANGPAAA